MLTRSLPRGATWNAVATDRGDRRRLTVSGVALARDADADAEAEGAAMVLAMRLAEVRG